MSKLKLPLHCYDEAGRILPSSWFTYVFFWGARAPIIVVAALVLGEQGRPIPRMVFPLTWSLHMHMVLGIGFIAVWLLQGRREWFWNNQYSLKWLQPALLLLVIIDVIMQMVAIFITATEFSGVRGGMLLITLFAFAYLYRSKRTRLMFVDWCAPN